MTCSICEAFYSKGGNILHITIGNLLELTTGNYPNKEAIVEPKKIFAGRIQNGMNR